MAANLPPYFFELQGRLKEVTESEEKISILEEMLAICPKHKGTEKVQKELKTKIAKLKKQKPRGLKREAFYSVPKKGAGEVVIIGPANSGKSSLLNALTNAKAKVTHYPFATHIPQPAMMPFEDILIQLVDTPPLARNSPGWLKALIFESDALLAIFDLSDPEVQKEIKNLKELLKTWKFENKKIILAGNKNDLEKARQNFNALKNMYNILQVSAKTGFGLEELKREIFKTLEIVRVYSKKVGENPDLEHPFIFKKNTRLIELAKKINENFASSFRYARLLTKKSSQVQIVGKDYVLKDKDIIEIHA